MNIMIGSKNPAKTESVREVFQVLSQTQFTNVDVPSGVSEQPFSDEETIKGAVTRAKNALLSSDEAEIGIGLEGGVQETAFGLCLCNWGALVEKGQPPIIAGGARILLPEEIAQRLRQGEELGPVMDAYAKKNDVRKNEGAVGIFTNGLITRKEMFAHVAKLLLGQFEYRRNK